MSVPPKFIAHRGNTEGPGPLENHPSTIQASIELGFDVEVDVWGQQGRIYLGHDGPNYEVPVDWVRSLIDHLWLHCKNAEAIDVADRISSNWFFHHADEFTLTSHGYVWGYPGSRSSGRQFVQVLQGEVSSSTLYQTAAAICSDYVLSLRQALWENPS